VRRFTRQQKRSRSVKESATEAGVIVARMVSQPIHLRMLPDCLRPPSNMDQRQA